MPAPELGAVAGPLLVELADERLLDEELVAELLAEDDEVPLLEAVELAAAEEELLLLPVIVGMADESVMEPEAEAEEPDAEEPEGAAPPPVTAKRGLKLGEPPAEEAIWMV
jgi:hypothetical protein